jgi:hypothetical protein
MYDDFVLLRSKGDLDVIASMPSTENLHTEISEENLKKWSTKPIRSQNKVVF